MEDNKNLSEEIEEASDKPKKKGFFARLKEGLTKTRDNFSKGMEAIITGYSDVTDEFFEDLEELLITSDMGVESTMAIMDQLRSDVEELEIKETWQTKKLLYRAVKEQMAVGETDYSFENEKSVVLVIGVNGVGKTTTVGKLAGIFKSQGKKVLISAADTFRAAATEQLTEWARRADVDIISGMEGTDPASVVYDSVSAARARNVDMLLIDTAGRLHNKKNLMEELKKINRIIDRELPDYKRENLIVLDGTTGQNALNQAREFKEAAALTGIVLTKMDGTSKGGIAIAIQKELDIPVKYIGVGETINDLQRFDPEDFINAIFERKEGEDFYDD